MLNSISLLVAAMVAAVGASILWANPRRIVNRAVFSSSLHIAAWLTCFHYTSADLFWLKLTCTVGGLIPLHLWLVKETIAHDLRRLDLNLVRRSWALILPSIFVAVVPFTSWFIPPQSTDQHKIFGWGYYAYIGIDLVMYFTVLINALKNTKRLVGGRRLELQVWLCGACGTALVILARMALRSVFKDQTSVNLQPLAVLFFYAGAAYAITTHKIFDARQIVLVGLEKFLLVGSVATVAFFAHYVFTLFLSEGVALVATTAVGLWVAGLANRRLDQIFQFYPDAGIVRQAIFLASRKQTRLEELRGSFLSVLQGWGHTDHSLILLGGKDSLRGGDIEVLEDSEIVTTMRQLRWASPERLTRERRTAGRDAVAEFLREHRLGAMVIAEGPTLTVVIGVGVAASRRPFTYPQVMQLTEVASIMESSLERAVMSVKAQRAEQLATVGVVGASLAHEIRNPLVTIKTFVQLLPTHYGSAVFRDKFFHLIGDEVNRIDRLTEQLLDLASPHTYSAQKIQLHPILQTSLELVIIKAADKGIQITTDLRASPDTVLSDESAAKQVLLNLCFNAIQAVELQTTPRWVKVSTRNIHRGVEMMVQDSGPGIAPEIRPRLFQPFQTTKSSGFGLGLAICGDILAGLDATITVDPSAPGEGAAFRVVFPCPV
jgi:signal transduction histidine kinase